MTEHTLDQVRQLARWLQGTDIALLELDGPGTAIRLVRNGAGEAIAEAPRAASQGAPGGASTAESGTVIRAGSVGLLLLRHPLHEQPLVQPGQAVVAGQPLALLRIGTVLLPVPAPRAGTVARLLAAEGTAVGYGAPLAELA